MDLLGELISIPLSVLHERLGGTTRKVRDTEVANIAASINELGLLSPITVRKVEVLKNLNYIIEYEIVTGVHRSRAVRDLGWTSIPAILVDMTDDEAEMAAIDENLKRSELTPAERSWANSRRKVLYEKVHPETAYEARPGRAGKCRHDGDISTDRFTAATAAATGQSERTIQRSVTAANRLGDDLKKVVGTKLDTVTGLDNLARQVKGLAPEARTEVIERAISTLSLPPIAPEEDAYETFKTKLDRALGAYHAGQAAFQSAPEDFRARYRAERDLPEGFDPEMMAPSESPIIDEGAPALNPPDVVDIDALNAAYTTGYRDEIRLFIEWIENGGNGGPNYEGWDDYRSRLELMAMSDSRPSDDCWIEIARSRGAAAGDYISNHARMEFLKTLKDERTIKSNRPPDVRTPEAA